MNDKLLDGTSTYFTLIASLPNMPVDYEQPHVPISRPRLENRLNAVDEQALKFIDQMFELLAFDAGLEKDAEKIARSRYAELAGGTEDCHLLELIAVVIDIRDVLAALRARMHKKEPPLLLGQYGPQIRRNWQQADFRLGLRFPWIQEIIAKFEKGEILAAEKIISQITWFELRRLGEQHHFSLRFLIAYLLQWLIVRSWAERNLERGQKRFSTLLDEAMNGYERLFD